MNLFNCSGTVLLSGFLLLSILLKLNDRHYVEAWLRERISARFEKILFLSMVSIEAVLLATTLRIGPRSSLYLIFSSGLLALISLLFRLTKGQRSAGCPCFGMASMKADLRADVIFAIVFVVELFSGMLSHHYQLPVGIFCAIGASTLVLFYLLSRNLYLKGVFGSKLSDEERAGLDLLGTTAGNERPVAVIFLSVKCKTCMSFLKYLEKFSETFSQLIDLRLAIDGIQPPEETLFGGGVIVSIPYRKLADTFAVLESPAMIVWIEGVAKKYNGVHACNLALSEIARTTLSRE